MTSTSTGVAFLADVKATKEVEQKYKKKTANVVGQAKTKRLSSLLSSIKKSVKNVFRTGRSEAKKSEPSVHAKKGAALTTDKDETGLPETKPDKDDPATKNKSDTTCPKAEDESATRCTETVTEQVMDKSKKTVVHGAEVDINSVDSPDAMMKEHCAVENKEQENVKCSSTLDDGRRPKASVEAPTSKLPIATLEEGFNPPSLDDFQPEKEWEQVANGVGATGTVHKARAIASEETYAIKKIPVDLEGIEDVVKNKDKWLRSVQGHDNVVRYYGHFSDRNYLVFELCRRSLQEEDVCKSVEALAGRVAPVVKALSHCLSHHMMHRDLKPHNLLRAEDGRIVLADFGLATLTEYIHGTDVGTTLYQAPECVIGGYREKADRWSLGVIIYQWIYGVGENWSKQCEVAQIQ